MVINEIDLRIGQPDEMRMHVGASPLLNLTTSVFQLLGAGQLMPRHVVAEAHRLARSIDLRPLRPMMTSAVRTVGSPQFVGGSLGPGFETMTSALDRLRDTPTDTIRHQLDVFRNQTGGKDGFDGWSKRPRHHLTAFVAALSEFEQAVFRVLVPHFEARLRTQVENLAVAVGTGQGPAVLSAVHPSLTRLGDTLRWSTETHTGPPSIRSMVIYPLAASPGCLASTIDIDSAEIRDLDLALTVPALAVRDLPTVGERPPRDTPLAALLGPGRTAILTAVSRTEGLSARTLSTQLRRPPTTITRDLAALHRAGLIQTRRAGPHTLYSTTIAGRRILTAWD
ncbi:MAG: winged helix-turn-helix domain-containing protein [Dermatophilaceae bacterium]